MSLLALFKDTNDVNVMSDLMCVMYDAHTTGTATYNGHTYSYKDVPDMKTAKAYYIKYLIAISQPQNETIYQKSTGRVETTIRNVLNGDDVEALNILIENHVKFPSIHDSLICDLTDSCCFNVVKRLIDIGFNVRARDDYILLASAHNGNEEMVDWLLSKGCDIHARGDDVLASAVYSGNIHLVKHIITLGCNSEKAIGNALCSVRTANYKELIDYLLSFVHDILYDNIIEHVVVNNLDAAKYLLSLGANLKTRGDSILKQLALENKADAIDWVLNNGVDVNINEGKHMDAAISFRSWDSVDVFLKHGFDLFLDGNYFINLLYYIACQDKVQKYIDIAREHAKRKLESTNQDVLITL